MGMNSIFRNQGGDYIASYSYDEIISATGYITLYLSHDSAIAPFRFYTETVYLAGSYSCTVGSTTDQSHDMDFDLAINKRKQLPSDKELVSIHVRRGDYLNHDHFCKLDTRYYSSAIAKFLPEIEKYHFVVFSNDIDWCKNNLIEENDLVTFLEPGTDAVDMMLMSLCDHNVIANSSFSWWAAFKNKNKNKKIICPKNYIRSYSHYKFLNGNYCLPVWDAIENDAT